MAQRTAAQQANRRRIERVIRVVAPALDLLLFAGHQVSRAADRDELDPEPARQPTGSGAIRTPIGVSGSRRDG